MKKYIYLGSLAAALIPTGMVVACGSESKTQNKSIELSNAQQEVVEDYVINEGDHFDGKTIDSSFTWDPELTTITDSMFDGAILPDGFQIPERVMRIDDHAFANTTLPHGFNIPKGAAYNLGRELFLKHMNEWWLWIKYHWASS